MRIPASVEAILAREDCRWTMSNLPLKKRALIERIDVSVHFSIALVQRRLFKVALSVPLDAEFFASSGSSSPCASF